MISLLLLYNYCIGSAADVCRRLPCSHESQRPPSHAPHVPGAGRTLMAGALLAMLIMIVIMVGAVVRGLLSRLEQNLDRS